MRAVLLNTKDNVYDPFVLRSNELDFQEIFPRGKIMRVLNGHADIREVAPSVKHAILKFIAEALK